MMTPMLSGYQIEQAIYTGTRTLVYRGQCQSDNQRVVIKFLRNDYPTFSELLQFRNQYTIAKNLNIPGIICPESLESCGNSYALVMEDSGAISLGQYSKIHALELIELLAIALQLADILHDLHANRVIHKDIKPANILIHPDTKQVKLIDFSIASLLPKETQEIKNPNVLEGTLAYISPEQTGRMNRGIDYRSDFYALGVTLFELLAGQLPYQSQDPMELVHCHIAQQPLDLTLFNIPEAIAQIVAKLMAKNAENRYQSALGLKYDLEICFHQLKETGQIKLFEIGTRDLCDRFHITEKLYGRENEVQTLLDAFDRVANGTTEMMLVAGFSGIGKTAAVNEVHKPIVRQRGYFIKGKFDQFNRNIPFSAFVQAFRDLMVQLLSESDARLQVWKSQILAALGENGQVIIEVIPELERIIGQQPPAAELSGTAAQNRFNLLFQKFLKVFTAPEHPLVMFLDDLQWADSASLNLIQLLMGESQRGYLLLIGAYRDNEVFAAHPLMLTLDAVVKAGATVNTITLQPLSQASLNHLVADTLHCTERLAQPLTDLVYQKTQGNPFFATQFLKALHQDELINFDLKAGHWQCDLVRVRSAALTDDVVEFMAMQLQKLPKATQEMLKLAACIGNQFDLATLAIVSEKSPLDTATALWKALQEGLILPISETYKFFQSNELVEENSDRHLAVSYKFLHDRVQQAAYSLIPEDRKQIVHLQIGRSLWQNTPATQQAERIFEIVGQFNAGIELITQPAERQKLAELNLTAGRKAKESTAYSAALEYLDRGIELLPADSWQTTIELTQSLYEEAAEAAFSIGDFDRMDDRINTILQNTDTLLDRLRVYELKIQALQLQGHTLQAIALGREILQQLGVTLPEAMTPAEIYQKVDCTLAALGERPIADLVDLPVMTDPQALAALRLMASLVPSVFNAAPSLFPAIACESVDLFVKHGNSPFSAPGYADFGTIVSSVLHKLEEGYQFGQLALKMLDVFPVKAVKSMTMFKVAAFTHFNRQHIRDSIALLQEAYTIGLETGDFMHMSGSALQRFKNLYFSGTEVLENIPPMIAAYHSTASSSQTFLNIGQFIGQTIHNLTQFTEHPDRLVGEFCDEEQLLPDLSDRQEAFLLHILFLCKSQLAYLFGDFPAVLNYSARGEQYLQGGAGMPTVPLFHYYYALARLAIYPTAKPSDREALLLQVQEHQSHLKLRAKLAPMNFQHQCDLLDAERYRILGNKTEAIELYDRALSGAKENGYILDEAIANELAAKFYLDWGKEKVAAGYMQEAYYCYAKWGAKAKTDDLENRYPNLLKPILQTAVSNLNLLETLATLGASQISISSPTSTSRSSSSSINTALDFVSILKASQSLSSTIQLDEVLCQLTQIILQNSGGELCALIIPSSNGEWQVRAIARPDRTELCSQLLENNPLMPVKLIQYVKNTQELVVIDGLQTELPVIGEYLQQQQPQSVLCLPILNQGNLCGILYLENRLTSGVFANARILILNFLCAQAAISLENARLYSQVQQTLEELQQAQLQIVQSEKMSALGNLVAGVAHEINNPVGCIVGNVGAAQDYINDLLGVIDIYQEEYPQPNTNIEEELEAIDLDYIRSDLPKLIKAMKDGGSRIKSISKSLRTFSRADSDTKQKFNLHEGINSTLLILRHRLKANETRPAIEVVTDYSKLPEIACFPGQLNQVFMNILANAIDALDESNIGRSFAEIEAHPNRITIRTMLEDGWVKIAIADNGKGMTEEVKSRIFDHLFTTKAVGKGTGLGLAIARQIVVEKHGGTIDVNSEIGKGTEFVLTLPIG